MASAPLMMHVGPHNVTEWLTYGALLLIVVGIGVLVISAPNRREAPEGNSSIKRRRR